MDTAKETILVADDDSDLLDLLATTFGEKYHVLQAKDGAEALQVARKELPHLVLLDIMMPRVSGLEIVRELQAEMETRAIPIILITGSNLDETTENVLRDNVNVVSFLNKPCSLETLTRQVRSALDQRIAAELEDELSA